MTVYLKANEGMCHSVSKESMRVQVDSEVKREAAEIFNQLGMDMSTAVNIFLYQCVYHRGLPFPVQLPEWVVAEKELDTTGCVSE